MNRAVFLDRDGVINKMVYNPEFGTVDSPYNSDEFELLPQVGKAINEIRKLGFMTILVSNQPGIALGKFNHAILETIEKKMCRELEKSGTYLDKIYYCLDHPDAIIEEYKTPCECRKPKPGMLITASNDLGIDLTQSYMIGDGLTDIKAGASVKCKTILIGKMKCSLCRFISEYSVKPDFICQNLIDATEFIKIEEQNRKIRVTVDT